MKSVIRLTVVAAVCSMALASADNAEARCCFLKKLFDRGGNGCCSSYEPACCEPARCGGCGHSAATDCGCGAAVSDCGCGTTGTTGTTGGVIIEQQSAEPTEASPADSMPAVPEPPAADGAGEAAEAAADASA
jgi:hypothetical protein